MSQNVKNTLYRFKTMRAPELIGDEQKDNHFVTRPTGVKSKFQGDTLGDKAFAEKAADHQLLHDDLKSLKADFGTFYKFAVWLTKNRTTVTKDTATENFSSVRKYQTGVETAVLESLWNDLHYLAYSNTNSYLRDAIISILAADAFYKKVLADERNDFNDDAIQRIAQARIILDLNLAENTGTTETTVKAPNYKNDLENAKLFLNSQNDIEDNTAFLEVVQQLESAYQKSLSTSKAAYDKTYEAEVAEAYSNATKVERVVTDKETGETSVVTEYENLDLPTYDFQPTPELDIDERNKPNFLSDEELAYLEELKSNYGYSTFQELKTHVQSAIKTAQDINLKHAPKPEKQIVYKGIPLPKRTSAPKSNSLELCFHKIIRTAFNYRVAFRIGIPNTSYVVSDMDYVLKFQDGTENANGIFNVSTVPVTGAAILIADLFPSNSVTIDRPVDSFECTVNFTNGEAFSFTHQFDASGNIENAGCPQVAVTWFDQTTDDQDPVDPKPTTAQPIVYGLQRIGIADYRKVEQEVCCYVPGEVSHIENIMAREYKDRSTTMSRRKEETNTTGSEAEREQLTDTTSTDRFEMNQEMASLVAQDQSTALNAGISFNKGGINAFTNGSIANNTSSEQSNSQAVNHAQELTERALDRVVQKIKEERVVKIVEEYEEKNSHGFDNRKGDSHISGVYRWVDKIYKNQIHNYGKRLMYEFMVPEPASFHNLAATIAVSNGTAQELAEPVDPRSVNAPSSYRITNAGNISEFKARYWAGVYNVELVPEPKSNIKVSDGFGVDLSGTVPDSKTVQVASGKGKMEVPEGYVAYSANYAYSVYFRGYNGSPRASMTIGGKKSGVTAGIDSSSGTIFLSNIKDEVGYSYVAGESPVMSGSITLNCNRTTEHLDKWENDTFNAIIEAYEDAKDAYDEKLGNLETEVTKQLNINPGFYRKIENDVLRKNCISYLIGHGNVGQDMLTGAGITGIRPVQNQSLNSYAETVKFFEQAFEWDIMSYYFYPFYWAKKDTWAMKYQEENNDPLFRAFLQSGMARVIVTVRPGFEEAVNWYLATGQIWNGGQVPTVDDDEFISIVEELQEPESIVEETWETRVPTSLTVIQAGSIGLNVEGLPCNTDCETSGLFDSDQNPIVQTNAQLGVEGSQRNIEFTWQKMDGGDDYFRTIGDMDGEGIWPRNYQILDRNISIDRDASWNASDTLEVLYTAIAEELSLTPGLEVKQVTTQTGADGLKFRVDVNTIPLLSFVKASENTEAEDKLSVAVNNNTVTLTNGMYFSDRILDKNGDQFAQDEHNTALPISRLLV